jgi:hypothetical protein
MGYSSGSWDRPSVAIETCLRPLTKGVYTGGEVDHAKKEDGVVPRWVALRISTSWNDNDGICVRREWAGCQPDIR